MRSQVPRRLFQRLEDVPFGIVGMSFVPQQPCQTEVDLRAVERLQSQQRPVSVDRSSPLAKRLGRTSQMPVGRGDDEEVLASWDRAWGSEDLREGIAAFRERRRPVFRGR